METVAAAASSCGLSAAAASRAPAAASIAFPKLVYKRLCLSFSLSPSLRALPTFPVRVPVGSSCSPQPPSPPRSLSSTSRLSRSSTLSISGRTRGIKKNKRKEQDKQQQVVVRKEECVPSLEEASISVRTLYQNGDPLGRRELGKCVVRWISQGMHSMASDFASAEVQGEFSELRQRMGMGVAGAPSNNGRGTVGSLEFVIQAQPYLYAVPMPKGLEALCFKACTHYPTLFDHFQRELSCVLQDLQRQSIFSNWRTTESWKLLKDIANSGICFGIK